MTLAQFQFFNFFRSKRTFYFGKHIENDNEYYNWQPRAKEIHRYEVVEQSGQFGYEWMSFENLPLDQFTPWSAAFIKGYSDLILKMPENSFAASVCSELSTDQCPLGNRCVLYHQDSTNSDSRISEITTDIDIQPPFAFPIKKRYPSPLPRISSQKP